MRCVFFGTFFVRFCVCVQENTRSWNRVCTRVYVKWASAHYARVLHAQFHEWAYTHTRTHTQSHDKNFRRRYWDFTITCWPWMARLLPSRDEFEWTRWPCVAVAGHSRPCVLHPSRPQACELEDVCVWWLSWEGRPRYVLWTLQKWSVLAFLLVLGEVCVPATRVVWPWSILLYWSS